MSWRLSRFPARRTALVVALAACLAGAGAPAHAAGQIGGPFALVNPNGKTVTDRDLRGHYALIYFGYTHCADLCPTALAKLARVLTLAAGSGVKLWAVFITVDPARDPPAIVGPYARQFSPDILALSGTPAAISTATAAYHVFVGAGDMKTGGIKHTSVIFLVGPDGQFLRKFSANETPEAIAKALAALPRTG